MKGLKRSIVTICILILANIILIAGIADFSGIAVVLLGVAGAVFYLLYSIFPGRISGQVNKRAEIRMQGLYGGFELLVMAAICFTVEIIIYLVFLYQMNFSAGLVNGIVCIVLLFMLAAQGILRLVILSKQVKPVTKILLMLVWWIPLINLILITKASRIARLEYQVETYRQELDEARRENSVCATKYPVLMVHGVFFRDWHYFNYWGRIPGELIRNGATVFYGNQQSALNIKDSARELRDQILQIIEDTKCEKLNIIAHSKGGLDARYAVSCLGMAPYVASLTTINTPHYGCLWVDDILKKIPVGLIKWTAKKYNGLFRKLGDQQPDFYSSIHNLTAEYASCFNAEVKDQEGIVYQSVMSQMDGARCAGFPLNIGYYIISKKGSKNDGLVPVESAKWGNYLGLLTVSGRRGISHGDMIDLNRENIEDFDVREFYVDLISGLKEKGL